MNFYSKSPFGYCESDGSKIILDLPNKNEPIHLPIKEVNSYFSPCDEIGNGYIVFVKDEIHYFYFFEEIENERAYLLFKSIQNPHTKVA